MQPRGCKRTFRKLVEISAWALMLCSVALAQIPTAQPPSTNINLPPPQRQNPAGGQRPQTVNPGIATAPQTVIQAPANGVIVGYVYWDTQSVTHTPANNCIGLGATVSVGTPPKGSPTFEQFKILGTYHNFTYLGNVGSLAVCQYSIPQVPTGQDLRVMVYFKAVFTPQVLASVPTTANNPSGTIKISGGTCNKVPPAVPNASVLGSGWWTCGNNAYNVNFVLQPANAGNMTSPTQITVLSQTPPGANGGQNSTNPGLLSGSNQSRGMLAPGTTQSAQSGSGTLLGNRQVTPSNRLTASGPTVGQNSLVQRPASQATNVMHWPPLSNPGTLSGFFYWDTRITQHNPAQSCSGLSITVELGNGATPREQFQTLGTFTNNFTYLDHSPQNAENLGFAPEWLGVCAYVVGLPKWFLSTNPTTKGVLVKGSVNGSAFSTKIKLLPNANYPLNLSNHLCPLLDSPALLFYPGRKAESCDQLIFDVNFALLGPRDTLEFAPQPGTSKTSPQ